MALQITRAMMGKTSTGVFAYMQVSSAGAILVASETASIDTPGAAFASRVVSAAATNLLSLRAKNVSAAVIYLHVFNAAALPANGTAPTLKPVELAPGEEYESSYHAPAFSTGLVLAASTTRDTLTVSGTSDLWCDTELRA